MRLLQRLPKETFMASKLVAIGIRLTLHTFLHN
jgi:hypothetical protein